MSKIDSLSLNVEMEDSILYALIYLVAFVCARSCWYPVPEGRFDL